jgi:hypothetical protein
VRFIFITVFVSALAVGAWSTQIWAAQRLSAWHEQVTPTGEGWHHYYRRHGNHWQRYYRPTVPVAPIRPLSCGEFRFWDGERCVDVRFR